jgi:predicted HTH transcriptional regulator
MLLDDLIHGNSKNIEYMEMLTGNSDKFTRTVVAFANGQGGKIIFGIADGTNEIVGIDNFVLFQMMDTIADTVYQSCEPDIVPEIQPVTVNSKSLIVVTVSPGARRPYYLKSKGRDSGTYVRIGRTNRLAVPDFIKDLEMEGRRISWDQLPCIGFKVTEEAIAKLCDDMNLLRKELQERCGNSETLPKVTATSLENWKLITKNSDGYTASNAFALLTSEHFQLAKTQCAVFKGTDRIVFLDKREYTGPLYEQIDEALKFVLRNIKLGATIKGVYRSESFELPVEAIREMIVNAHCHRNFNDDSCVQVALYDNRLEVTSPGGLYNGLTFENAMNGHSRLRNRSIANVFCQIGLIESWGTGLRRIKSLAAEFELPVPEFIETNNFPNFSVISPRIA